MLDNDDEDNLIDDQDNSEDYEIGHDRIIFLIDGRSSMFDRYTSKNESYIANSLSLALAVMKSKIIANENTFIGITFFGVHSIDNMNISPGIYTLFTLAPPSAERIRKLQELLDHPDLINKEIRSQSSSITTCPLKIAIWSCSQSFATISKESKSRDMKRLWIFTDDDQPNKLDPVEQQATVTVAKDTSDADIEISLWYFNHSTNSKEVVQFDVSLFYMKLLRATIDVRMDDDPDMIEAILDNRMERASEEDGGFDTSIGKIKRKDFRKRRLGSCLFDLANTVLLAALNNNTTTTIATATSMNDIETTIQHMAVGIFKNIHILEKPKSTFLYVDTLEPLKPSSKYLTENRTEICEEINGSSGGVPSSTTLVTNNEIRTYFEIAGSNIPMCKEELNHLKQCNNKEGVGIQVLFYMPKQELKLKLQLETSYFVYPDEKLVSGSNLLFEMLLSNLSSKNLIGIVRFNRNHAAPGRLAALIPQSEQVLLLPDKHVSVSSGLQVVPPGFYLILLPYAEDIRCDPIIGDASEKYIKELSPEQLAATQQIINDYTSIFPSQSYRQIQNPAIQQYYSVLQAVALNQKKLEWDYTTQDQVKPNLELLLEQNYIEDFNHFKDIMNITDELSHDLSSKKRTTSTTVATTTSTKRTKQVVDNNRDRTINSGEDGCSVYVDELGDVSEIEITAWCSTNQLDYLTTAQLNAVCRGFNLTLGGKKDQIINRIKVHFRK